MCRQYLLNIFMTLRSTERIIESAGLKNQKKMLIFAC